jgi:hypothetical protein
MLDLLQKHHLKVYHARELKMFHCERGWKIPLSRLDLRMLIKFLCKDEANRQDPRWQVHLEFPGTMY